MKKVEKRLFRLIRGKSRKRVLKSRNPCHPKGETVGKKAKPLGYFEGQIDSIRREERHAANETRRLEEELAATLKQAAIEVALQEEKVE